jgi:hypothetical protein
MDGWISLGMGWVAFGGWGGVGGWRDRNRWTEIGVDIKVSSVI